LDKHFKINMYVRVGIHSTCTIIECSHNAGSDLQRDQDEVRVEEEEGEERQLEQEAANNQSINTL
jgi:hypothetical protein